MKRDVLGGRRLSQSRHCRRCGKLLGLEEASMVLIMGRFIKVCRDEDACRQRQTDREKARRETPGKS